VVVGGEERLLHQPAVLDGGACHVADDAADVAIGHCCVSFLLWYLAFRWVDQECAATASARSTLRSASPMLVVIPMPVVTVTTRVPGSGFSMRNSEPGAEQ